MSYSQDTASPPALVQDDDLFSLRPGASEGGCRFIHRRCWSSPCTLHPAHHGSWMVAPASWDLLSIVALHTTISILDQRWTDVHPFIREMEQIKILLLLRTSQRETSNIQTLGRNSHCSAHVIFHHPLPTTTHKYSLRASCVAMLCHFNRLDDIAHLASLPRPLMHPTLAVRLARGIHGGGIGGRPRACLSGDAVPW